MRARDRAVEKTAGRSVAVFVLTPYPGVSIHYAARVACGLAALLNKTIEMQFNGVNIFVPPEQTADETVRIYNTKSANER